MSMILVARALERIGDNAVDIGEQTVFVVTGLFRELGEERTPLPRDGTRALSRRRRTLRRSGCENVVTGPS